MDMVRQDHDGIDDERVTLARFLHCIAQGRYTIDE
jgi:hypothetical protein